MTVEIASTLSEKLIKELLGATSCKQQDNPAHEALFV